MFFKKNFVYIFFWKSRDSFYLGCYDSNYLEVSLINVEITIMSFFCKSRDIIIKPIMIEVKNAHNSTTIDKLPILLLCGSYSFSLFSISNSSTNVMNVKKIALRGSRMANA